MYLVRIQKSAIKESKLLKFVKDKNCGAVVLFLGTARKRSEGKIVKKLFYEAFEKMAVSKIVKLIKNARKRFKIHRVAVVHRVGDVKIGEVSIGISCSSEHRIDSFKCAKFLIDKLKKEVPIWKKEYFERGAKWVSKFEKKV